MTNWKKVSTVKWIREDGAIVKWDQSSPYPNPINSNARMWIAFEPEPSQSYLRRESKRGFGFPRRWKTAESARNAVDIEFPLYIDIKQ